MKIKYFVAIASVFTNIYALEPGDVTYDGSVLTVPYVRVGDIAYELKLAPTSDSTLSQVDCQILCLKLLSAGESSLTNARNPATFDGTTLSTPRVILDSQIMSGQFTYLAEYAPDVYFSVVAASEAPIYSLTDRQNWTSDQLEARFSFCHESSYRWDTPFPFGDFNNDGYEDIFVPITCYQGEIPDNGGDNDVPIKSGWFLLCSDEFGGYSDCSKALFGEEFIDTSKDGGKGGAPYHHNTEEPKDLNGDGYLDFLLTLNRDDGVGREKFDPYSSEGFQKIVNQCFEGDTAAAEAYQKDGLGNCAYFSEQYVFLSNGDGTYSNVKVPWAPTWTHSLRSLPNELGGYDIISVGYDIAKVARIDGNTVTDITDTYKSFENYDDATQIVPYVGGYFEFDSVGYWITSGVKQQFISNIAEYADFDINTGFYSTVAGITLWKWNPGQGFELSDYYIPSVSDYFNYTDESGNQATGVYQKDIPQFGKGRYHFFKQAVLDPSEGPILVVQSETSGFLENYRRTVPADFTVSPSSSDAYEDNTLYPLTPVEGFVIADGKITNRDKSVVEGDVMFNSSGMHFRDFDSDGFDDLVTITGMQVKGGAYINDGDGVLQRIDTTQVLPQLPQDSSAYAYVFWPLRNNNTLDVIYMALGATYRKSYWNIEEDGIFRAGDVGVIRSNYEASKLPVKTVDASVTDFRECAKAPTWSWSCPY